MEVEGVVRMQIILDRTRKTKIRIGIFQIGTGKNFAKPIIVNVPDLDLHLQIVPLQMAGFRFLSIRLKNKAPNNDNMF